MASVKGISIPPNDQPLNDGLIEIIKQAGVIRTAESTAAALAEVRSAPPDQQPTKTRPWFYVIWDILFMVTSGSARELSPLTPGPITQHTDHYDGGTKTIQLNNGHMTETVIRSTLPAAKYARRVEVHGQLWGSVPSGQYVNLHLYHNGQWAWVENRFIDGKDGIVAVEHPGLLVPADEQPNIELRVVNADGRWSPHISLQSTRYGMNALTCKAYAAV